MKTILKVIASLLTFVLVTCSERPTQPEPEPEPLVHEPWEDEEAENLAWLISGELTAPRKTYDRIQSDLASIRAEWGDSLPPVRTIKHLPISYGSKSYLAVESSVRREMELGEYHDWDSVNALLGAAVDLSQSWLTVESPNRINIWRMIEVYESLRGVRSATYAGGIGDGSNLYAIQHPWGIGYLFRAGFGDCYVGCIYSRYYYFRARDGEIEYAGVWLHSLDIPSTPTWWYEAQLASELWEDGDEQFRFRDTIPPAGVLDLKADSIQVGSSLPVTFTGPGEDGLEGTPKSYVFRWGATPITEQNWNYYPASAQTFDAATAGAIVSLTLTGLHGSQTNYIAMRTVDRRGNNSPISNTITSRNIWAAGWTYFDSSNSPLPNNGITALHCDRGTLWIGTTAGVARYNGFGWKVFTKADIGLRENNAITAISSNQAGEVWVGSYSGLARYDGEVWTAFTTTNSGLPDPEIRALAPSPDGGIWIGIGFLGVVHFDGNGWTQYAGVDGGFPGEIVRSIAVDRNGASWFAFEEGLARLEDTLWTTFRPYPTRPGANYNISVLAAQDGSIWCGSYLSRVSSLVGENWFETPVTGPDYPNQFETGVRSIKQSEYGHIWTVLYGSLRLYDPGSREEKMIFLPTNSGLPTRNVTVLEASPNNTLWIGTANSGLCRWDLNAAGFGTPEGVQVSSK